MTSWSDWKDDEKLEAALRSLVAINLKHKEIFGLVCRDFLDYKWNIIYKYIMGGLSVTVCESCFFLICFFCFKISMQRLGCVYL